MQNYFNASPLWKSGRKLALVAQGVEKADIVITNAKLVNVCTREIQENISVAISEGRIALVGEANQCIGENTRVIDAEDQYIAPGFLDGHMHIESSMMSVGEFGKAVIPHGTIGVYFDPHEMCNVLGLEGVKCMLEDAKRVPLKAMLTTPSCVPAVPGFEDTGAFMGPKEVAETMKWDCTVGLGEMMNFPGILSTKDHAQDIVAETLKAGKIVTGHYSLPETGAGLNAYIASGIRCCHESTREEDALAKMRLGMYAQLREGSAWRDLKEVAKAVTKHEVDSRFAMLITDDTHPNTIITNGHLDHLVRRAQEEGIDAITAIQMVTINCAQCFQMDHELGSITPGKCADIVFMKDLKKVDISRVMIDGKVVAENGEMVIDVPDYEYPDWATHSIHIKDQITPQSFQLKASKQDGSVKVHAMEIIPANVVTKDVAVTLQVKNGLLESDLSQDVLKTVVFERHHETGTKGFGFTKGFGIKKGAMAATVAHDAHNLLVVGTNDEDMSLAANTLIESNGGMVAVADGKVIGHVELPIAGLMNNLPAEVMSEKVGTLSKAWEEIGCKMPSPFMTMALIPLACLPELRLTNRGLVDCTKFEFVDLEI